MWSPANRVKITDYSYDHYILQMDEWIRLTGIQEKFRLLQKETYSQSIVQKESKRKKSNDVGKGKERKPTKFFEGRKAWDAQDSIGVIAICDGQRGP